VATHKYLLEDGTRVPGVTTVIGRFKEAGGLIHWANQLGMEGIDYRDARDTAADAGTLGHSMVDKFITGGEASEAVVDFIAANECDSTDKRIELAQQAYQSFKIWWSASKIRVLETEVPLVSEEHRFGGCLDGIGVVGNENTLTLLDWKTSNRIYGEYLIQIRAYGALWLENRGEQIERYNLARFGKEGADFHYHSWSADQLEPAWGAFLQMRELYETMKQLKALAS